jgi:opacity protein-like surface antigen
MKRSPRSLSPIAGLASALLLGLTLPTLAADRQAPRIDAPLAPPVLPEDYSSGWYVRGDVTADMFRSPAMAAFSAAAGGFVEQRFTRAGRSLGGGLGFGFKYKGFRVDTTLDIRAAATFSGFAPPQGNWNYVGPLPVPSRFDRFGVSSQTLLVNAYADLGTVGPLTPYVGVGLGTARLTASRYVSTPVPAAAALGEATVTPVLANTTKWTLAWAAMAGVTVDVTPQTKIDIGYRYLHMGSLRFVDTAGGSYRTTVAAHEVRVGLRYMFAD